MKYKTIFARRAFLLPDGHDSIEVSLEREKDKYGLWYHTGLSIVGYDGVVNWYFDNRWVEDGERHCKSLERGIQATSTLIAVLEMFKKELIKAQKEDEEYKKLKP